MRSPLERPRYWRWMAICAALTLATLAVAYLAGSRGWLPAASGARRSAAVPRQPAGARTMAPSGAGKLIARAAPPPPPLSPRLARALTRWDSARGGAAMASLTSAVASATQQAGLAQYAGMRQACGQVAAAVTAAKGSAPIPDARQQRRYAGALRSFARAAADCESAISVRPDGDEDLQTRQNQPLLHRSLAEFASGGADLYGATAKIRALILSAPSQTAPRP
jgi:hypothetical protein